MKVYCDGGCHCHGPNKVGGWAIVTENGIERYGAEKNTTSQRMELVAAIEALETTAAYPIVEVVSDSKYLVLGMTEWRYGWVKRTWKGVKNVDLWQKLIWLASTKQDVKWTWTRGHSGDPLNERCDVLNQGAISRVENEA